MYRIYLFRFKNVIYNPEYERNIFKRFFSLEASLTILYETYDLIYNRN